VLAAALLGGAMRGGTAQDAGTPVATAGATLQPAIGLLEAQDLALAGQPGAAVRSVKLEGHDEALAYEVKLTVGDDLEVDAASGQVREAERGDGARAGAVAGTPRLEPAIGLAEAQEAALAGQPGAAVRSVKLDGASGVLAYEVELVGGGAVAVDAASGLARPAAGDDDDGNGGDDEDEDEDEDDDD
jgi:uncharacterized membrane protein YkoI